MSKSLDGFHWLKWRYAPPPCEYVWRKEVSPLLCLIAFDPIAFRLLALYLYLHRCICIFSIILHLLISKRVGGNEFWNFTMRHPTVLPWPLHPAVSLWRSFYENWLVYDECFCYAGTVTPPCLLISVRLCQSCYGFIVVYDYLFWIALLVNVWIY